MKRTWVIAIVALGAALLLGGGAVALDFANKAEWAKYMWTQIGIALPFLSVKSRLMVLAHAAFESGWGSSGVLKLGTNNVFNITTNAPAPGVVGTDGWKGQWILQQNADDEYDAAGNVKRISQKWRAYPSIAAALQDYWSFLGASRYEKQGVRAQLEAGNVAGFVNALYRGGYFTLPPDKYLASFDGVMRTAANYVGVTA